MGVFTHIWKHYNKRMVTRPRNYILYILVPLTIILANFFANIGLNPGGDIMGVFVPASLMVLAFQYLTGEILMYNIFTSLRGKMAERLFASPVKRYTFITGMTASSFLLNLLQSAVIMGVITIAFGVNLGNPAIFFGFLLLTATVSQLIAALVSGITKSRKAADGLYTAIVLIMFVGLEFIPPVSAIFSWITPLGLAWQGIIMNMEGQTTSALINMALLTGITTLVGWVLAPTLLGRRNQPGKHK
ncbi:MAG: ABC transporter permease [Defluviitaleaceae bacterium]|nr:ABC transporter permease [Defluviitaleaceae bacterium]